MRWRCDGSDQLDENVLMGLRQIHSGLIKADGSDDIWNSGHHLILAIDGGSYSHQMRGESLAQAGRTNFEASAFLAVRQERSARCG